MTTIFIAQPPLSTIGNLREKTFDGRQRDDPGISKPGVIATLSPDSNTRNRAI
jgi:hypothetical protein